MTSFGRTGITAAAAVALLVIVDLVLASSAASGWYTPGVRYALYGLAAVAAAAAASTFGWWREPVGRPWMLFFVEFALLFVNYALRRTAPNANVALDVTLIVANLAQIGAYWLVARSLQASGIASIVPTGRRVALTIVALVVALLISQSSLIEAWQAMRGGQASAASLIALLTDIVTFTLIAPLAIGTVALRGGQLFWIFAFLTISVFGWIFNELGTQVAAALGGTDNALRTTRIAGIAIATLFNAAAATTQWASARRAVKGVVANA